MSTLAEGGAGGEGHRGGGRGLGQAGGWRASGVPHRPTPLRASSIYMNYFLIVRPLSSSSIQHQLQRDKDLIPAADSLYSTRRLG